MTFVVETEVFSGPFDLLLHLILKDDVDLYEVNLADIVDAFLEEVKNMQGCDLEVSTEFLLIASTLIELKCRRLLPSGSDFDLDEELGIWEERDQLLARLLECKTFKDASNVVRNLFDSAALNIPRTAGLEEGFIELAPDPLAGMTAQKLQRSFMRLAVPVPVSEVSLHHVAQIRWSVTEAMQIISKLAQSKSTVKFSEIVASDMERLEVVVHFLAVLEMYKQGQIDIVQATSVADLELAWLGDHEEMIDLTEVDVYDG